MLNVSLKQQMLAGNYALTFEIVSYHDKKITLAKWQGPPPKIQSGP